MNKIDLSVELSGVKYSNPVMVASGCVGFGEELSAYIPLDKLGALLTKGLSLEPKRGNKPPRTCEVAAGMINSIGLENPGFEAFAAEKLPFLRAANCKTIVNVFGHTQGAYEELCEKLDGLEGIAALEINISCPNVDKGGRSFGANPQSAAGLTKAVRAKTKLPLFIKLSPMVGDIVEMARAVEAEGADGLSLINTIPAMAIDLDAMKPVLGNITGGLSGAAIKPVALYCVWKVYEAVKIPIIGLGGIYETRDALEFIAAGARAVQIGTANFFNPKIALEIIEGIKGYLYENKIAAIKDLIGAAHK